MVSSKSGAVHEMWIQKSTPMATLDVSDKQSIEHRILIKFTWGYVEKCNFQAKKIMKIGAIIPKLSSDFRIFSC